MRRREAKQLSFKNIFICIVCQLFYYGETAYFSGLNSLSEQEQRHSPKKIYISRCRDASALAWVRSPVEKRVYGARGGSEWDAATATIIIIIINNRNFFDGA